MLLQVPITHVSQSFISSSKPYLSEIIFYLLDMTWGLFIHILCFWRWRIRGLEIQVHRHALSHTIFRYQNWSYPSMLLLKFPRSEKDFWVFPYVPARDVCWLPVLGIWRWTIRGFAHIWPFTCLTTLDSPLFSEWLWEAECWSLLHSRLWLCGLQPPMLLSPWNSLGKSAGVGCHALLKRIFPTQESNAGLLHCRQVLYHWATRKAHTHS